MAYLLLFLFFLQSCSNFSEPRISIKESQAKTAHKGKKKVQDKQQPETKNKSKRSFVSIDSEQRSSQKRRKESKKNKEEVDAIDLSSTAIQNSVQNNQDEYKTATARERI
jgi:hypothetical protein